MDDRFTYMPFWYLHQPSRTTQAGHASWIGAVSTGQGSTLLGKKLFNSRWFPGWLAYWSNRL